MGFARMPTNSESLQQAVLQQVNAIPRGSVSSYGRIASAIGYPSHSRFVGTVLKALPANTQIPWHRVVNSQGKSSFPLGSPAYQEQKQRLEVEGVPMLNGKIDKGFMV